MDFRTEEELLEEALSKAQMRNLISPDDDLVDKVMMGYNTENQYIVDLSTHAYMLSTIEDKVEEKYNDTDLNTATGEALDKIGNILGVYRSPATASVVEIDIVVPIEQDNNIYMPSGTPVILDPIASASTIMRYTLMDDYTIPAGATNLSGVRAVSDDLGSMSRLPRGSVIGVEGFVDVTATNYSASSGGRDIEEDDDYRQRIKNWAATSKLGSRAYLENYLSHLDELKEYRLIPLWDGVGTLKIVCDCLNTDLDGIREKVQRDCMIYTDDIVQCVLVEEQQLEVMDFTVWLGTGSPANMTLDELSKIITGQVNVYINGGTSRSGNNVKGLGIGDEFDPSKLISFLHGEIPEANNIRSSINQVIEVDEVKRLIIERVEVTYEWSRSIVSSSQDT